MQETVRKSFLHNCSFADLQLQMTADAVKEPAHCVQEIINEWMFKRPMPFLKYFIRSGLVNFIKMMKARDVRLGIYSDYPCDKKLQHMRIADYFAAIVSSFDPEVLKFKPDPRGFLIASEKLGLTPDEILFIGDRVNVDAAGAAHSGMQVVLVGGFLRTKGQVESYPRYRSFNDISREIFSRSSI
jgi:HAD superfamily hydrolase (TIGR01549 family)